MEKSFSWGRMIWLAGAEVGNATSISVARMFLSPSSESEAHLHDNCEEAILVVRGSVEVSLGEEVSTHAGGACVVIPAGVSHRLKNVGEVEAELTLVYGAGKRAYEPC